MASCTTTRWMIVGNSGSGKRTLTERMGAALNLPVYDLDLVHWHTNGRKRDEADAKGCVAAIAGGDGWVIEGVYGWLVEIALPRTDMLIWLDMAWDDCRAGLLARSRSSAWHETE